MEDADARLAKACKAHTHILCISLSTTEELLARCGGQSNLQRHEVLMSFGEPRLKIRNTRPQKIGGLTVHALDRCADLAAYSLKLPRASFDNTRARAKFHPHFGVMDIRG